MGQSFFSLSVTGSGMIVYGAYLDDKEDVVHVAVRTDVFDTIAALGAISWFWIMKKQNILNEVNKGTLHPHGALWYSAGRYLYVPCALILCMVALFMQIAF